MVLFLLQELKKHSISKKQLNMNKLTIALFILTISWGCTQNSPSEKFQGKRNNVIDISKRVKR